MKWARYQGTLRSIDRSSWHLYMFILKGNPQHLAIKQLGSLLSFFCFADKVLFLGEMSEVRSFVSESFEFLAPDLFLDGVFPS